MNPPCVHNVRCIYFLTPKATEADSSSCSANMEKKKKKNRANTKYWTQSGVTDQAACGSLLWREIIIYENTQAHQRWQFFVLVFVFYLSLVKKQSLVSLQASTNILYQNVFSLWLTWSQPLQSELGEKKSVWPGKVQWEWSSEIKFKVRNVL